MLGYAPDDLLGARRRSSHRKIALARELHLGRINGEQVASSTTSPVRADGTTIRRMAVRSGRA